MPDDDEVDGKKSNVIPPSILKEDHVEKTLGKRREMGCMKLIWEDQMI